MSEEVITAAELFIGRAQKFNRYQEGEGVEGRSCHSCIRRRLSFPYTCDDGWPIHAPRVDGRSTWVDRGATCINWTDDPSCRVD